MRDSALLRASRELYVSVLAGGTGDVNGDTIERLATALEEENVAAGRRIFSEGESVDHVYFARHGRVRLERNGAPPLTVEGSAAYGAFEAVGGRPHARTAVAFEDLLLMRLPTESWVALLDDDFDLARLVVIDGLRRQAELELEDSSVRPKASVALHARAATTDGPIGFVERVALLSTVPMLRAAGVQVLVDLAAVLTERTFERDERVHARGVASGRAFIVVEGDVLGQRRAPDRRVAYGPGSIVCGAAWLGEPQLAWETHAARRTRVLVLDAEHWFDMMEEHAELLHATLGTMALTRDAIVEELAARQAGDGACAAIPSRK